MFIGYLLSTDFVSRNDPTDYRRVFCAGALRNMPVSAENGDEFNVWLQHIHPEQNQLHICQETKDI
jgi:hypothetical protein